MTFDISALQKQTTDMNAAIDKLRKDYQEAVKTSFAEATKSFFEATPEVSALFWTQYTPYFNDGDTCYFSVHDIYYNLSSTAQEEDDYEEDEEDYDEGNGFLSYTREETLKSLELVAKLRSGEIVLTEEEIATWDYYYLREQISGGDWNSISRRYNPVVYAITPNSLALYEKKMNGQLEAIAIEEADYPNREQSLNNINAIIAFLNNIDDNAMEEMFGDHVQVVITRTGVEINEHEHD